LTRARVVLGDEPLTGGIEEVIRQAVYSTGADDTVRKEIHRLRTRMEVELAREKEGSYNIKTGRGGIVDVEFIVQFLQLSYGRDYPDIRTANTLAALKFLTADGLLSAADSQALISGYKFLRRLENRLRIIHDYSMNDLGGPLKYLNKLARGLGYDPKLKNPGEALLLDYEQITAAVRGVYDRVFGGDGENN
jgi:glutamate-ammonia-ligase adenylyltransferase